MTITSQNSGTYYYSVYLWGGDGTIKNSPAVVKVYNSAGLVQTYYASAGSGDSTKDWWRVCTLNGGALTTLNTFADSGK